MTIALLAGLVQEVESLFSGSGNLFGGSAASQSGSASSQASARAQTPAYAQSGIQAFNWGGNGAANGCAQPSIQPQNWYGGPTQNCSAPTIQPMNWNGGFNAQSYGSAPAHYSHDAGISGVNWSSADFAGLRNCHGGHGAHGAHGMYGAASSALCVPPSVNNGVLTMGDYTYQFSGTTLTMKNTCTGETTSVWGDPHVTSPNGHVDSVNGNFTFNLQDGTKVTVITDNGVQADPTIQSGCVATPSYAQKVVVDNGAYTSTLNNDGSVCIQAGSNDPLSQQGLQGVERNGQWVPASSVNA